MSEEEEEIDYRTVKMSLRGFCKNNSLIQKIQQHVKTMEIIVTEAYHLLYLHVLRLLENGQPIPVFTELYLRQFLNAVSLCSKSADIDDEILSTMRRLYLPLRKEKPLPRRDRLHDCFSYATKSMKTAIENNIKMHFFKRQYLYLRATNPRLSKEEVQELQEEINERKVSHRGTLPDLIQKGVAYDLTVHPERFLPCMYRMNRLFETKMQEQKQGKNDEEYWYRTFSLLPLRRGFRPRAICIDTRTLSNWTSQESKETEYVKQRMKSMKDAQLKREAQESSKVETTSKKRKRNQSSNEGSSTKDKRRRKSTNDEKRSNKGPSTKEKRQEKSTSDTKETKPKRNNRSPGEKLRVYTPLWAQHFYLEKLHPKTLHFAYKILTNGVDVSILRTRGDGRKKPRRKKKEDKIDEEKKEKKDKEALKKRIPEIRDKTIVGVDPGKYSQVYMTTDDGKGKPMKKNRLQYTTKQRKAEMGTTAFAEKRKKMKIDDPDIQALETRLSYANSRSCSIEGFSAYLTNRFEVEDGLYKFYSKLLFRIHKWRRYKNKQRSEAKLVKNIKRTFGDDPILAVGTWTRSTQMKGCEPSLTIGMRKLLKKHFTVVDVPEYKTTMTCSKCKENEREGIMKECQKRVIKGRERWVRGLRRCINNECQVFMNRDYNAAINIRSNLLYFLQHGDWDPCFKPEKRTKKNVSDPNPRGQNGQIMRQLPAT